jgi:hypothetical protein
VSKIINLNSKTLEKLRELINTEIEYKSGPRLVEFFNEFGFNEEYGNDFPSRWQYTDSKLNEINNTAKMEQCILKVFNPINFIESPDTLKNIINVFNEYLAFDNYVIKKYDKSIVIESTQKDTVVDETVQFDEAHIHIQWQKAIDRKISDPEGAITTARTLIESVLKYILDEKNIKYNENTDLSELYKEVSKSLNLAPEQHQEKIFKQILGGANGIISGLGSLRNKLGDAHGKSKANIKPKERHSELAVNLAGAMALFLYKTYKEECHEV